jgi:creatinine amidohydrolase/Fe(II)-dependent formamide hydrolase-like protein
MQAAASQEFQGLPLDGMLPDFQGFPVGMALRLQDLSPASGGYGDPTYASTAQGEAMFARMVAHVCAFVDKFASMDIQVSG